MYHPTQQENIRSSKEFVRSDKDLTNPSRTARTANRNNRQDLPTPESPISSNCEGKRKNREQTTHRRRIRLSRNARSTSIYNAKTHLEEIVTASCRKHRVIQQNDTPDTLSVMSHGDRPNINNLFDGHLCIGIGSAKERRAGTTVRTTRGSLSQALRFVSTVSRFLSFALSLNEVVSDVRALYQFTAQDEECV